MVQHVRLDPDTMAQGDHLPGGPIYTFIEEDAPGMAIPVDKSGHPTRGGTIGYFLAYILLIAFIGYFFVAI
jgi:hypothetical protein